MDVKTSRLRRSAPTALPLALASFALLAALSAPLAASMVRELSLLELERRARTIVHVRCLARNEHPEGTPVPYTEYTFEVLRTVKDVRGPGARPAASGSGQAGTPLPRITVRHAGTTRPAPRADGLEVTAQSLGLPQHQVGSELVLFLTPESRLGLCAPVGLSQGTFEVERKGRNALVRCAHGAALLGGVKPEAFTNLTSSEAKILSATEPRVNLDDFLGLCSKVKGRVGLPR